MSFRYTEITFGITGMYYFFYSVKYLGDCMFSLFSLSGNMGASGPKPIDLELLSDAELLQIWDQTQNLINSLEEEDLPTHVSSYYSFIIELELQTRAQLEPTSFFQLIKNEPDKMENNKFSLPTPVLAKNIII